MKRAIQTVIFYLQIHLKTAAFRQQMQQRALLFAHAKNLRFFAVKTNVFGMPCSHETHGFSRGILGAFHISTRAYDIVNTVRKLKTPQFKSYGEFKNGIK